MNIILFFSVTWHCDCDCDTSWLASDNYHILSHYLVPSKFKTRDEGEKGDREIQVKIEKPFKVVYTILALLLKSTKTDILFQC